MGKHKQADIISAISFCDQLEGKARENFMRKANIDEQTMINVVVGAAYPPKQRYRQIMSAAKKAGFPPPKQRNG